MEQDAAEFDEIILEGVPIKQSYKKIKYLEFGSAKATP